MTDDFSQILDRLQGNLGALAKDPSAAASDFEAPEVEGHGTAHEEQIRVTMASGKFTELTIDPRAMRLANAELAEHLLAAFNQALEEHTQRSAEALLEQHPSLDPETMQAELRQIQTQSLQAMKKYTDSMFDALGQMNRINTGGGR